MALGDKSAEIRAGIVVLIALAILGAGLFIVSGGWERFKKKEYYTIYFRDAGGLGEGDSVQLNGLKAGQVHKIESNVTKRPDGEEPGPHHAVTVELYAGSEIPLDSDFVVAKTITNVATLYITSGEDTKRLADESTDNLYGRRLARFDETVDSASKKLETAGEAIKEFKELAAAARAKIDKLDMEGIQQKIDNILGTVQSAVSEIETAVKSDEGLVRQALVDLRATAASLEKFSSDLKGDWPEIEAKVQTILDNVKKASAEIRDILEENRPDVRTLIGNVKDASHRIAPLLASFEGVGKEANAAIVELRPDLVRAVKTAAQAFDNFESVTEDLKTAPWKLINKPSESESDEVHLYNAARLYVDAATRINENIEDLDTLRRLGVLEDPNRTDLVTRTLAILQQSLKEFEEREKKLVALIQAQSGN